MHRSTQEQGCSPNIYPLRMYLTRLTPVAASAQLLICAFLFTILTPAGSYAAETGGYQKTTCTSTSCLLLKQGVESLEKGQYEKAVDQLKRASEEVQVIGDYILFFIATAQSRLEQFGDSNKSISDLLEQYPDSPLKRRSRLLKFYNLIGNSEQASVLQMLADKKRRADLLTLDHTAVAHLESYVADYPDDGAMTYLLAKVLKKRGENTRAKRFFKSLYIGNGPYTEHAYQELAPSDISPDDRLSKASNLIRDYEYRKAEMLLRDMLPATNKLLGDEIHQRLGMTLFKQKKYTEAGAEFSKAGDIYNLARSQLRSGDAGVRKSIATLTGMEDNRTGSLLTAIASKKRREGEINDALTLYQTVKDTYPANREDALWGIAWTHYRTKKYDQARDFLQELQNTYPHARYGYWKQRSIEQLSPADQTEVQKQRTGIPGDFYSLLEQVKNRTDVSLSGLHQRAETVRADLKTPDPGSFPRMHASPRFTLLMELGMREDAVTELVRLASREVPAEELFSICRTLQDVGEYKRALTLASRLSGARDVRASAAGAPLYEFLFPIAYWPTISAVAQQYTIDPYLILSIMREESRYDARARSSAGALGLMQLMPQTAQTLDKKVKLRIAGTDDIYDVRINITLGAFYLNTLLQEFKSLPAAVAAYNAGEERVREWLREGQYASYDEFIEDIPFDETRNYVKRVLVTYATYLELRNRHHTL